MDDTDALREHLTTLRREHRALDDAISRLSAQPGDQLEIQRLKKRKLALKDQIRKIEGMLWPDIIA
jgi:hypothetical protein